MKCSECGKKVQKKLDYSRGGLCHKCRMKDCRKIQELKVNKMCADAGL